MCTIVSRWQRLHARCPKGQTKINCHEKTTRPCLQAALYCATEHILLCTLSLPAVLASGREHKQTQKQKQKKASRNNKGLIRHRVWGFVIFSFFLPFLLRAVEACATQQDPCIVTSSTPRSAVSSTRGALYDRKADNKRKKAWDICVCVFVQITRYQNCRRTSG